LSKQEVERVAGELARAVAGGDPAAASVIAFRWARTLAGHVARPLKVDVSNGRHTARYWVVAVDWFDWAGAGQTEPRHAHLARAWLTAHGGIDDRHAGLIGTHPQNAEPEVVSRETLDLPMLGETWLDHIAREAREVLAAFEQPPTR
jgi:hypothetical protein